MLRMRMWRWMQGEMQRKSEEGGVLGRIAGVGTEGMDDGRDQGRARDDETDASGPKFDRRTDGWIERTYAPRAFNCLTTRNSPLCVDTPLFFLPFLPLPP